MSDELNFTPDEEQMRQAYWHYVYVHGVNLDRRDIDAEFTRGMEQVKAQVRAEEREKADREPSDAEVEAGARALWDARRSPTNHTWDAIAEGGLNRPYPTYPHIVDDIRREARAALIAAQEVRDES